MFGRLLVAVDQVAIDQDALELTSALALSCKGIARVVHVREHDYTHGIPCLETEGEAWGVVEEAVFELRMVGVGASGQVVKAVVNRIADAIVEEARSWQADAVVLGSRPCSPVARLFKMHPVHRRLRRISSLPIVTAPESRAHVHFDPTELRLLMTQD